MNFTQIEHIQAKPPWRRSEHRALAKMDPVAAFLPAAGLAIMVMHLGLTLGLSGNEDQISVFGIGIEGAGARWIGAIWREGLMRFLEPWAFVAAAGIMAPARKVPSISAAAGISLLFVALLGIQLNRGGPAFEPVVATLRAAVGVAERSPAL